MVAASRASFAFDSWILALWIWSVASATWRLRSVVSAVARTAPFLTVSPTLAFRLVTFQVVEAPDPVAVAPAMWAGAPKLTPYESLAATEPVAATWSVTSPVVTALVRYRVVLAVGRRQSADRHESRSDADDRQCDDGQDLEFHRRLP